MNDIRSIAEARRLRELPPNHGRLLDAGEVAEEILRGTRTPGWVRRTVPNKIRLGHSTVRWWEADVVRWIDAQKE